DVNRRNMTTTQAPRPSHHKGFRIKSCYYILRLSGPIHRLRKHVTSSNPAPAALRCLRTAELGVTTAAGVVAAPAGLFASPPRERPWRPGAGVRSGGHLATAVSGIAPMIRWDAHRCSAGGGAAEEPRCRIGTGIAAHGSTATLAGGTGRRCQLAAGQLFVAAALRPHGGGVSGV